MAKQNQIAESINRALRRFIQVQQFNKSQTLEFNVQIAFVEKFIRDELSKYGKEIPTIKDLKKSLTRIEAFMEKTLEKYETKLVKNMVDLSVMEAGFERTVLQDEVIDSIKVKGVKKSKLQSTYLNTPIDGRFPTEVLAQFNTSRINEVKATIRNGYYNGSTVADITKQLRGTPSLDFADGILLGKTEKQAETLVRTLSNHAYNSAREELFEANADIVQEVEFIATLDDNTTLQCAALDGQTFNVKEKHPEPPLHYNCRSILVPIIFPKAAKPNNTATTRASRGSDGRKPVDSNLRFGDWLKNQSAEFQDSYLGKDKGKLFREGELSLNKFVDKFGDPYTLDQLEKLQPQAFKKANLD